METAKYAKEKRSIIGIEHDFWSVKQREFLRSILGHKCS